MTQTTKGLAEVIKRTSDTFTGLEDAECALVAEAVLAHLGTEGWAKRAEVLRNVQPLIESERRWCYEQQEVRHVWVNALERMNVLHRIITRRIDEEADHA